MRVSELRALLDSWGVIRQGYALPGDHLPYEGFVLEHVDGRWDVVYCSRGIMNPVSTFTQRQATEHNACVVMLVQGAKEWQVEHLLSTLPAAQLAMKGDT
jgi:hypothetical protein